jgi:hypothetical protein
VKPRQIVLTDAAVNDILEQAAWYQEQSGLKLADRWEKAVSSILLRLAANPAAGAPCSFKAIELAAPDGCLYPVSQNILCSTASRMRKWSFFALFTGLVIWKVFFNQRGTAARRTHDSKVE